MARSVPKSGVQALKERPQSDASALERIRREHAAGRLSAVDAQRQLVDVVLLRFVDYPTEVRADLRRTLLELVENDGFLEHARALLEGGRTEP